MRNIPSNRRSREELQSLICEGVIEGIRQEVERRRRLGIPLYIDRDGQVVAVMADGSPAPEPHYLRVPRDPTRS